MKQFFTLLTAVSLFSVFILFSTNAEAQVMSNYCQVPPYVTQNVPPNVMVVMDNSGSMMNFAFSDGFNTTSTADDNDCISSGSPCTNFTGPGTYPAYKYYGYFDPDYWYTYGTTGASDGTSRFYTASTAAKTGSGLAGARAKTAAEWDGSFLNWLSMRRVDVLKKVLTGGKSETGETGSYLRLVGENADVTSRGVYKQANVTGLVDNTYSGTRCFIFDTGSGVSNFTIRTGSSCGSGSAASFNVKVRVKNFSSAPLQGVLQDISTKVRLGLTFYDNTDYNGGVVMVPIGNTNLSSIVSTINGKTPDSNTPLAETLWTVTGDFAQQTSLLGGPGPRYHSGDFTIDSGTTGIVNDPLNYGTKASPKYPSCSKSFVLFITDGEPCADGNLPASLSNYSGVSPHISAFTCSGGTCPATSGTGYSFPASTFESCGAGGYTAGFEDVALYMHTNDLRSGITGSQSLTLYPVFVFGSGSTLLKYAAINGGFIDSNGNNLPDLPAEWDSNGDGQPDTYYEATEGADIEQSLKSAFSNMISRVSSGTAAAVLASGEGSGANLVQASFYPRRRFGSDVISWVGGLQALWYYLDPAYLQTNIFEDTTQDKILNLSNDDVMAFYYNSTTSATMVQRWPYNVATGTLGTKLNPDIAFESVRNIWDGGKLLWSRNLTTAPRKIYTQTDGMNLMDFSTANAATLATSLNVTDLNGNGSTTDEAFNVITWLTGNEVIMDLDGDGINDYRPRTVQIGSSTNVWKLGDILNSTPKIASNFALNPYWSFWNNKTDRCAYCDNTYDNDTIYDPANPPSPPTAYVKTPTYQSRGVVFVGANDGMLHAFKLGTLQYADKLQWPDKSAALPFQIARLVNPDTGSTCKSTDTNPCGKELWAFIPKNVLPYLQAVPDPDYCHLYSVDLTPFIVDASINKPSSCNLSTNYWDCDKDYTSWRTIVIGGMRLGGACRNMGTACNNDGNTTDCVNTPVNDNGYSSYFALDVTDQNNPQLLWEKSAKELPGLGFSTSGPAVVRIKSTLDPAGNPIPGHNGRWFVVFGSGPTGPIDTTYNQFLGRSDQDLQLFVLDLKTGQLLKTFTGTDTGIHFAFSGSLFNATHDLNWPNDTGAYQDDIVYVPYVEKCDNVNGNVSANCPANTWLGGGVGNIVTKQNIDPTKWVFYTIIDGVGPVTSGVQNLDDENNSWLFFGTGRHYFAQATTLDDAGTQRRLYGIKHPCQKRITTTDPHYLDVKDPATCSGSSKIHLTDPLGTVAGLKDVTNVANAAALNCGIDDSYKGWYINLDSGGNCTSTDTTQCGAERNTTDPYAATNGVVYFTTMKPYTDVCSLGGKSFIWAVNYCNGAAPNQSLLTGKAMVQLSTGSIEQKDLKTAFTDNGLRRTGSMEGEPPPGKGLVVIGPPSPVMRVLQIKER